MRVGLQLNNFTWPGGPDAIGSHVAKVARMAEEAGFSTLWVMDHFFQIPNLGQAQEPMLEGYSALSYVAGVTSRLRLGTLVTGVTYRHPAVLIKTVTTLDVLSGGRAYFGVGAAWFEREHSGLGVPFPPLRERFERLEETLQIAHRMWAGDSSPYTGAHYRLEEPLSFPRPVQKPHPPVMVGGSGEQKTLRMVARYGDACNLFARMGRETLQHKLEVLKSHCEAEKRSYDDIEKTSLERVTIAEGGAEGSKSSERMIEDLHELAAMGFDQAIISLTDPLDERVFDALGSKILPAAARIVPAGRAMRNGEA